MENGRRAGKGREESHSKKQVLKVFLVTAFFEREGEIEGDMPRDFDG